MTFSDNGYWTCCKEYWTFPPRKPGGQCLKFEQVELDHKYDIMFTALA